MLRISIPGRPGRIVVIIAAALIGIGGVTAGAQPGRSPTGVGDPGAIPLHDVVPRPTDTILNPEPRGRPPPPTRASPASQQWAADPRAELLQAAAQAHRSGSPGLLTTEGCPDCPTLGARGMSEARLAHSQ
jgi:hypothetical protein